MNENNFKEMIFVKTDMLGGKIFFDKKGLFRVQNRWFF
jgi:hypothetical protein